MSVWGCMRHYIIVSDSIGLSRTADLCIGGKVSIFGYSKTRFRQKQEQFLVDQNSKARLSTSFGGYVSVIYLLTFSGSNISLFLTIYFCGITLRFHPT